MRTFTLSLVATIALLPLLGCGGGDDSAPAERPSVERPQAVPSTPSVAQTTEPAETTETPTTESTTTTTPETSPETTPSAEPAASTGTEFARFTGRVTVDGNFPGLPPLVRAGDTTVKDQICTESDVPDDSVIITDGALADVFVYAKRVPDGVDVPPASEDPVKLDQKGCRFLPQATVLRVDQPLKMVNSDPVAHNVRISGFTMTLNQTIGPNDQEGISATYTRAERVPVQTKCDIHTWMSSWHLPTDHPWATVSDADGTFVIDELPAGDWEFIVWHNKTGYVNRSVKFSAAAGQVVEMNFSVPAADLQ